MLAAALATLALAGVTTARPAASVCADGVTTVNNPQCCFWANVRDRFINEIFLGVCQENVHSLVRIAFHDAIGFSLTDPSKGGGADGSIIMFGDTELNFHANEGIDFITAFLQPFADTVGVTYGDAIQFGAAVGLSLCPGAPTIPAFVGRPNATMAAPDLTVPEPFDDPDKIFARMADAGFTPVELIHLLASHSIADQAGVDPEPQVLGAPFDSTPFSFDSQVFLEVLFEGILFPGSGPNPGELMSPLPGEFRLQSDKRFSLHNETACAWQENALSQSAMASNFQTAFTKLSLLGHDQNSLLDCSELIAQAPPATASQGFFPAGKTMEDLEIGCDAEAFPTTLVTQAGQPTMIPPVDVQDIAFGN
ncbi:generic peroxidase [Auricularia subglabra TFB-10046 SS5]|uniref:Peroxidase n=1 Tax=Auricularia subglabra (strain TFB-10046 / SS5) TaxID=717982 RepID=J0WUI3_AURST|nr:generic peroxidase [Auricularia subglabra TFB-10046 SS5]